MWALQAAWEKEQAEIAQEKLTRRASDTTAPKTAEKSMSDEKKSVDLTELFNAFSHVNAAMDLALKNPYSALADKLIAMAQATCLPIKQGAPISYREVANRESAALPRGDYSVEIPAIIAAGKLGDICSKCGHEFKERELFVGTFVGCMC